MRDDSDVDHLPVAGPHKVPVLAIDLAVANPNVNVAFVDLVEVQGVDKLLDAAAFDSDGGLESR
jgi:hypothetical protein